MSMRPFRSFPKGEEAEIDIVNSKYIFIKWIISQVIRELYFHVIDCQI